MASRIRLPESLACLTRTEKENAIYQAALCERDTTIATMCIVERCAQADIAEEVECDRSTVSRHIRDIIEAVDLTAARLYAQK